MCYELTCSGILQRDGKRDIIGPTFSVKTFRRFQGSLHERTLSHKDLFENPDKDLLDLTDILACASSEKEIHNPLAK